VLNEFDLFSFSAKQFNEQKIQIVYKGLSDKSVMPKCKCLSVINNTDKTDVRRQTNYYKWEGN